MFNNFYYTKTDRLTVFNYNILKNFKMHTKNKISGDNWKNVAALTFQINIKFSHADLLNFP